MSIEQMSAAVVQIKTASGNGSGFYIKDKNIIVTNFHVISGSRKVGIRTQSHDDYTATVALINPLNDIAFLVPNAELPLPAIRFQQAGEVRNTDKVTILGFPLGMPFTVTEGIISSVRQVVDGKAYIQTDAAINPGNSGGPMVNAAGEIIGIATARMSSADNIGFALPIQSVVEELSGFQLGGAQETAVKCPACSTSIFEKTEYCPNCGAKLEMDKLFPEETISPFAQFVEKVFDEIKIDPAIARNGPNFWEFYQGSALIRYFVYKNNYFYATSPLCSLPKTNLEALYRYLLSDPVPPYSLAIALDKIYLSYRIYMSDIKGEFEPDIQKHLAGLAMKADEMDNYLVNTFGCQFVPKGEA